MCPGALFSYTAIISPHPHHQPHTHTHPTPPHPTHQTHPTQRPPNPQPTHPNPLRVIIEIAFVSLGVSFSINQ